MDKPRKVDLNSCRKLVLPLREVLADVGLFDSACMPIELLRWPGTSSTSSTTSTELQGISLLNVWKQVKEMTQRKSKQLSTTWFIGGLRTHRRSSPLSLSPLPLPLHHLKCIVRIFPFCVRQLNPVLVFFVHDILNQKEDGVPLLSVRKKCWTVVRALAFS